MTLAEGERIAKLEGKIDMIIDLLQGSSGERKDTDKQINDLQLRLNTVEVKLKIQYGITGALFVGLVLPWLRFLIKI